ncbi:MAG: LysM peptidoglycan-binding domain-containing protein [Verrucomicrobiales bacterium]
MKKRSIFSTPALRKAGGPKTSGPQRVRKTLQARTADQQSVEYDPESSIKLSRAVFIFVLMHVIFIGGLLGFQMLNRDETRTRNAENERPVASRFTTDIKIHRVQENETLTGIANHYSVGVQDLILNNNLLNASNIRAGQELRIPIYQSSMDVPDMDLEQLEAAARQPRGLPIAPGVEERPPTSSGTSVASRETTAPSQPATERRVAETSTLARPVATPRTMNSEDQAMRERFLEARGQTASRPSVDEVLERSPEPATTTNSTSGRSAIIAGTTTHVVEAGENPYSIAQKYGVNYQTLLDLNDIDDPRRLKVGAVLRIPE